MWWSLHHFTNFNKLSQHWGRLDCVFIFCGVGAVFSSRDRDMKVEIYTVTSPMGPVTWKSPATLLLHPGDCKWNLGVFSSHPHPHPRCKFLKRSRRACVLARVEDLQNRLCPENLTSSKLQRSLNYHKGQWSGERFGLSKASDQGDCGREME